MKSLKVSTRNILFATLFTLITSHTASAAIFVMIPSLPGDVTTPGFEGSFEVTNFDLAAVTTRALQPEQALPPEVLLSFLSTESTTDLLFAAFDGQVFRDVEVVLTQTGPTGGQEVYLKYKLDRCFIKSWSTSGDADDRPTEEIAFYYNKIEFSR